MPVQVADPYRAGAAPGTARRAVLLTGASGVVGRAVLKRLRDLDVVCLVHRSPVSGPNVTTVPGDVAKPMFGLAKQAYLELAARVDAVIHCAAITDFNRTDGSLEATNIAGTEHAAAFAAAANAVLYHVSTAFVDTTADGARGRTAIGYASSKLAAEQVVRSSGVPHVILRPSVVIGDSATGEIAAFQGLHQVVSGIFAGIVELARGLGVNIDMPRFVPPDMFDRLIGPVFLDALPAKIRRNVLRMLEFFTIYLQSGQTKPSSLDQLVALGARPLPDQRESLRNSLRYWAAQNGYGQAETGTEKAA
jgi:Male sterility protein